MYNSPALFLSLSSRTGVGKLIFLKGQIVQIVNILDCNTYSLPVNSAIVVQKQPYAIPEWMAVAVF